MTVCQPKVVTATFTQFRSGRDQINSLRRVLIWYLDTDRLGDR
jgi:hypothetical protein